MEMHANFTLASSALLHYGLGAINELDKACSWYDLLESKSPCRYSVIIQIALVKSRGFW